MSTSDFDSYSELDDSSEDETDLESEVTVEHPIQSTLTTANGPFPKHVAQVLESFYARGMKVWGKQHRPDIISASETTGLKQSQIEVGVAACKASVHKLKCNQLLIVLHIVRNWTCMVNKL